MICPKAGFEEKLFEYLKEEVISLTSPEIENIYSVWRTNFDVENGSNASEMKKAKAIISPKLLVPPDAWLLGVDLPVWFNSPDDKKLRIMVLGIDPLRNERVFKNSAADRSNDVVIGTPYALHNHHMRMGSTSNYWSFIEKSSQDHFVYLTDIYKVFFYSNKLAPERSYSYYKRTLNAEQKSLLKKEIELINPHLIVTLGAESFVQLTNEKAPKLTIDVRNNSVIYFDSKFPVLPMVHLSGSTRKNIITNFLRANGIDNNGEYKNFGKDYCTIVNTYLQNHPI